MWADKILSKKETFRKKLEVKCKRNYCTNAPSNSAIKCVQNMCCSLFRCLQRSTTAWFRRAGTETTRRTPGTETWGDRTEILAKGKSSTLGAMKLCKIKEELREGYQGQCFHRIQPPLGISFLFLLQIFDENPVSSFWLSSSCSE